MPSPTACGGRWLCRGAYPRLQRPPHTARPRVEAFDEKRVFWGDCVCLVLTGARAAARSAGCPRLREHPLGAAGAEPAGGSWRGTAAGEGRAAQHGPVLLDTARYGPVGPGRAGYNPGMAQPGTARPASATSQDGGGPGPQRLTAPPPPPIPVTVRVTAPREAVAPLPLPLLPLAAGRALRSQ